MDATGSKAQCSAVTVPLALRCAALRICVNVSLIVNNRLRCANLTNLSMAAVDSFQNPSAGCHPIRRRRHWGPMYLALPGAIHCSIAFRWRTGHSSNSRLSANGEWRSPKTLLTFELPSFFSDIGNHTPLRFLS